MLMLGKQSELRLQSFAVLPDTSASSGRRYTHYWLVYALNGALGRTWIARVWQQSDRWTGQRQRDETRWHSAFPIAINRTNSDAIIQAVEEPALNYRASREPTSKIKVESHPSPSPSHPEARLQRQAGAPGPEGRAGLRALWSASPPSGKHARKRRPRPSDLQEPAARRASAGAPGLRNGVAASTSTSWRPSAVVPEPRETKRRGPRNSSDPTFMPPSAGTLQEE